MNIARNVSFFATDIFCNIVKKTSDKFYLKLEVSTE